MGYGGLEGYGRLEIRGFLIVSKQGGTVSEITVCEASGNSEESADEGLIISFLLPRFGAKH